MNDNNINIYELTCIRNKECPVCNFEKANRKCEDCKCNISNKQNTDYYKCFKCFTKNKGKCKICNKYVDKNIFFAIHVILKKGINVFFENI